MKKISKIGFFAAAIFLLAVIFSGCGNSVEKPVIQKSETPTAAQPDISPIAAVTTNEKPAQNQIRKEELTESAKTVKIGESEIQVVSYKSSDASPLYFRPHENESTSGEATREIIRKHGGNLVELKSKGDRMISFSLKNKSYTFDPNRIFSAEGISKTLSKNGDGDAEAEKAVAAFVETLFAEFLTDKNLLVAVHNNTNGEPLSVESYRNSEEIAAINVNPNRDADDFFYVTSEPHFNFFKEKGFNVVRQNTATVGDDGSLSVYCGKRGIAYINVESERGHLNEQIEMMEALQELSGK